MKYNPDDSIGFLLNRTNTRAKNELLQVLKPYDLTPEQWGLLKRLWDQDGVSQKYLAERTSKDQPTTARILQKMERKGLIERRSSPDDARVLLVFLTDRGRNLEEELIPLVGGVLSRALSGFTEGEVEDLRRMLNRIFHNLG